MFFFLFRWTLANCFTVFCFCFLFFFVAVPGFETWRNRREPPIWRTAPEFHWKAHRILFFFSFASSVLFRPATADPTSEIQTDPMSKPRSYLSNKMEELFSIGHVHQRSLRFRCYLQWKYGNKRERERERERDPGIGFIDRKRDGCRERGRRKPPDLAGGWRNPGP